MVLSRKSRSRRCRATTLWTMFGIAALAALSSCSDDEGDGEDVPRAGAPSGGRAGAAGSSAGRGGRAGGTGTGGAPAPIAGTGSGGEGEGGSLGGIGGTGGEVDAGGSGGNGPPNVGGGGASGEGGGGRTGAGGEAGNGAVCGDGTREPSEECDDGGVEDADGCSATCAIEYVLDRGHIDVFELTYDDGLVLRVKDDTQLLYGPTTYLEPERVVVNVDASRAVFELPDGLPPEVAFLGTPGTTLYFLDANMDEDTKRVLPWPGWTAARLQTALPPELLADMPANGYQVEFDIEVSGPGDVFVFMSGGEKFVDTTDDVPERISTAAEHRHANWAFTAQGDYVLKVTPRLLQLTSAAIVGPQHEFRFHIGTRLVAEESAPVLTMDSPQQEPYRVGQTIEFGVSAEPEPANPQYAWWRYRSSERVHENLDVGGHTLSFTALQPAVEDVITVQLISNRTGRLLAQTSSSLSILE